MITGLLFLPGHFEWQKYGFVDFFELRGEPDGPEVVQNEGALNAVDEAKGEVPRKHVRCAKNDPRPSGQEQVA